jgi:hypothetical protein
MSLLPTERQLHASIVQWAGYALPQVIVHHAMNEGRRGGDARKWLRESGAQTGWPDLEVLYYGCVLFLELKIGNRPLTLAQDHCHNRLRLAGFRVALCRSFEQAQAEIHRFVRNVDGADERDYSLSSSE